MRIAIPSKGRLHTPSVELLRKAGLRVEMEPRRLIVNTSKPEVQVLLARAKDIPEYVEAGAAEAGITGMDLVEESGAELSILIKLNFGKARVVVAVPENSGIEHLEDLEGRRVATEFPNITRKFFSEKNIDVQVIEVSGACETAPQIGISDAIVDLTSSGETLSINRLKSIYTIMETEAVLVAGKDKEDDVSALRTAIESVIKAEGMRYVMMNVPEESLDEIKKVVPGLKGPTVMKVEADEPMLAVHVVVHEDQLFDIIEKLKRAGARDILVTPIQRMVI